MATTNIDDLLLKKNNAEAQEQIREDNVPSDEYLTAEEFVKLVQAIKENQLSVKAITLNGKEFSRDENGLVKLELELPDITTKVGFMTRSTTKEEDGLYHIRGFADEAAYLEWMGDKDTFSHLVLTNISIPDMASTAASYVLALYTNSPSYIVSTDNTVKIGIRFVSQMYNPIDQSTTDTGETGVLTIQTRLNTTSQWQTKGSVAIDSTPANTELYKDVDISDFLVNGEQQVRVIVKGDTSEAATNYVSYTVVKTALGLTFANAWEQPITGSVMELAYRISGAVNKLLHVVVKDTKGNIEREVTETIGKSTYIETPFVIRLSDENTNSKVLTQGIHKIEAWLSVVDSDIVSERLYSQVLVITDAATAGNYIILNELATEFENWTNVKLFSYAVYSATDSVLPVTFSLTNYERTNTYMELSVNAEEGKKYTFENMIEIEEEGKQLDAYMDITSEGVTLTDRLGFVVDNSNSFAPTAGADFILNPRIRTNESSDKDVIINSADNSVVPATFKNFGFVRDGWVTDSDGVRCLRVLAGSELTINYEYLSQFITEANASVTVELDFATRNVTDMVTPILRMCSYDADGFPRGFEMRPMEGVFMTQDKRVYKDQDISFGEGVRTHVAINIVNNLGARGVNYIRMFVNGKINREISYAPTDEFLQYVNGIKTSQGIRIGAAEAEIDIYGIRIYKSALSATDVRKDKEASLPTAAEKVAMREANDILGDDGTINYDKTKAKYNCLLWKFNSANPTTRLTKYGDTKDTTFSGDLVVDIFGDDKHSGIINDMTVKGQGTSSMSYWKWNQRFQFGDNSFFTSKTGDVTEGYALVDGVPLAVRLDGKLNWASPMQSHKLGSTSLYNDLQRAVVGGNPITQTEGFENCRTAVIQKPFYMFQQTDANSEPVFVGLFTWGPGKGDKPTFGYDKSVFPDFIMLEGADNGAPLVTHRVPWNDDVTYDEGEEAYMYNGAKQWEVSMGKNNLIGEFIEAFNFIYELNPDVHPFVGTAEELKASKDKDTSAFYWVTQESSSANRYDLYRYDILTKSWVDAGIQKLGEGAYAKLNINSQCGLIASGNDWDATNRLFVNARADLFGKGVGNYFNVEDLKFTMSFLKLIAASDNWAKNTYLVKSKAGDKIFFFQDDLDTIFISDNVGRKVKPYYVEEHDVNEEGKNYWNASRNGLYCNMENAFPNELRTTMRAVLTAAANLGGGTLMGAFDKYYFSVQRYFPAVAYNEIARLLYEDAEVARLDGRYETNTPPLPQSLGDQLQSEMQWVKLRCVYISSYASYGEFASGDGVTGALAFRSVLNVAGNAPTYSFDLTPHIWLYPSIGVGDSVVYGEGYTRPQRVKAGETFTLSGVSADGNTNIRILGINYYRSIGEFGDKALGEEFTLSGERLTEFSADGNEFRPTAVTVVAPNIRSLKINKVQTIVSTVDLTKQWRLGVVDLRNTSISNILLPESELTTHIYLPTNLSSLILKNQPNLEVLELQGVSKLQRVELSTTSTKVNSYSIFTKCYVDGAPLNNVKVHNINWVDVSVELLLYLANIAVSDIRGKIAIYEPDTSKNAVTFDVKNALVKKFGNIDNPDGNLYITYFIRKATEVKINGKRYLREVGSYEYDVKPTNAYANDFTNITLQMDENPFATISGTTVNVNQVSPTAFYTNLKGVYTSIDGIELKAEMKVGLFDRQAELGDLVYYDGEYGKPEEWDGSTPVVGVCFYINPDDPTDRRMTNIEPLLVNTGIRWGVNTTDFPNLILNDDVSYDVYKIPKKIQVVAPQSGAESIKKEYMLDPYSKDGYTVFDADSFRGYLTLVELDDDLDFCKKGDVIPIGLRDSLATIKHRNKILSDSYFNLPIPTLSGNSNADKSLLTSYINDVVSKYGNEKYSSLYYPVISYGYTYSPNIPNLHPKFQQKKWWVSSIGELARIVFHAKQGYEIKEHAIFAKAFQVGAIGQFNNGYCWAGTELNNIRATMAQWYNTDDLRAWDKYSKNQNFRLVCRF